MTPPRVNGYPLDYAGARDLYLRDHNFTPEDDIANGERFVRVAAVLGATRPLTAPSKVARLAIIEVGRTWEKFARKKALGELLRVRDRLESIEDTSDLLDYLEPAGSDGSSDDDADELPDRSDAGHDRSPSGTP